MFVEVTLWLWLLETGGHLVHVGYASFPENIIIGTKILSLTWLFLEKRSKAGAFILFYFYFLSRLHTGHGGGLNSQP